MAPYSYDVAMIDITRANAQVLPGRRFLPSASSRSCDGLHAPFWIPAKQVSNIPRRPIKVVSGGDGGGGAGKMKDKAWPMAPIAGCGNCCGGGMCCRGFLVHSTHLFV